MILSIVHKVNLIKRICSLRIPLYNYFSNLQIQTWIIYGRWFETTLIQVSGIS